MKKCIALAKKSEGKTAPNPLVGAIVLDKNGEIAGTGRHEKYGQAHAEVNAINAAGERAKGGTIIVNLEPCSHYGKTPPCADLIIKTGIKKVVVGMVDPNPLVAGKGIKKCQDEGIEVITGVLEKECKELNEIFIKNQTAKTPFIAIKTATTLDGKIAAANGSSKWITGEKSRACVQKLRNKYDAILTGSNTVITDNPSLTARTKGGINPKRIIIDSQLKTPADAKVYIDDGTPVYIAVENTKAAAARKKYPSNVTIIPCPLKDGKTDLHSLIKALWNEKITSIMVEAGGMLNGAFVKEGLAHKLYKFTAPKILGDNNAKSWICCINTVDINDSLRLKNTSVKTFGEDTLLTGYFI